MQPDPGHLGHIVVGLHRVEQRAQDGQARCVWVPVLRRLAAQDRDDERAADTRRPSARRAALRRQADGQGGARGRAGARQPRGGGSGRRLGVYPRLREQGDEPAFRPDLQALGTGVGARADRDGAFVAHRVEGRLRLDAAEVVDQEDLVSRHAPHPARRSDRQATVRAQVATARMNSDLRDERPRGLGGGSDVPG